jgi:hypothetical protein
MRIRLFRSNSLGFAGTIRNANHHAKALLPLLFRLAQDVQGWGYAEWMQAHNTHSFVTKDARKIHLRGLSNGTDYIGVTLEVSNLLRCAQGNGTHIADFIVADPTALDSFSDMMRLLAKPPVGNAPHGASESEKTEEILV